jgi:hypothetical protein
MAHIIPTRKAVAESWDAYAALCQAAAKDPLIANDDAFQTARDRAHKRWSDAFMQWDGK